MEFINLPFLQKKVSRIGLGTWAIGGSLWGGTDEDEAIKTILEAFDRGINLIDTAPAYGKGKSEEIVGKAIKRHGNRDNIVIATKAGLNQEGEGVFRDSRKESLTKELNDSLKRLQVDFIDIYQIHWPDPKTPIAETAETMRGFLESGKIKAIGVSNYSVEQLNEFKEIAPLTTLQPPYNLFEREIEKDLLPYCKKENIGILAYSSLCRGLLSGKMTKDREFKGDDLRKGMDPKFKEPRFSEYLKAADALKEFAEVKFHKSLPALAVRWVLDKGASAALWGARKPEQLDEMKNVSGWKLTPEDLAQIDKIISENVKDPVGPQFMSPPERE
jgi:aryl-alcohol dehydrogenase-like predicted oxidoreductase